jgi:VWFA-related protein
VGGNQFQIRSIDPVGNSNSQIFMLINRRELLGSSLSLILAQQPARARSQDSGSQPTFTSNLRVVDLFATVKDKHGALVKGLKKEDFVLTEDGRPQTIRYFTQETDLPLTLGLVVDTSGSERRMIEQEREASRVFFNQVLRENRDRAFLIHFDSEVELLKDLTGSKEELEQALASLSAATQRQRQAGSTHSRGNWPGPGGNWPGSVGIPGGGGRTGRGRRSGGHGVHGGTKLFDAVFLSCDELMSKQNGRKALILLTDGEDNGSKTSQETAIEAAQKANTLVYSILIADPEIGIYARSAGDRTDGKKVLQQLARKTGGSFFQVSKDKTIAETYAAIEEELRNQYSLGYTPGEDSGKAGYRTIQLAVKQKNCVVQTRDGYYSNGS